MAYADPWYTTAFNGDDVRALALGTADNYTVLDIIGTLDFDMDGIPGEGSEDDPGDGFSVAGVADATKDHTLVKKSSVTFGNGGNWWSSAGATAENSDYIVLDQDDFTGLGSHTVGGGDCADTEVTINVADSYGDGWNGNVLTIGDEVFGLETGDATTYTACLVDANYTVTCGGGSYPSEALGRF